MKKHISSAVSYLTGILKIYLQVILQYPITNNCPLALVEHGVNKNR